MTCLPFSCSTGAYSVGTRKGKKDDGREAADELAREAKKNHQLVKSNRDSLATGSNGIASCFSQRGKKGINQDCFVVWEGFGFQEDMMFCGMFDGHGPWGHYVSKRVRDSLPSALLCQWQKGLALAAVDSNIDYECSKSNSTFDVWKQCYLRTCALVDKELDQHQGFYSFSSGTTSLAILKQISRPSNGPWATSSLSLSPHRRMAYAACVQSRPLYNAVKPLFVSAPGKLYRGYNTFHHFNNLRPLTSSCSSNSSPPRVVLALALARRGFSSKEEPIASPADLQYESPLKIVEYPDPLLRKANKYISTFDDNLKKLVDEMFDVMYKTDGIGLSAPQVGLNIQLMVFNPAGERGVGEELVVINPRVYKYSKKIVPFNEGCLSFPGIYADVERPAAIKVDAQDITGDKFSISLKGLPARVFQHEFDHLQGILFFERMSQEVLDGIRQSLQDLEKKYESRTGLLSPEKIENVKGIKVAAGFS